MELSIIMDIESLKEIIVEYLDTLDEMNEKVAPCYYNTKLDIIRDWDGFPNENEIKFIICSRDTYCGAKNDDEIVNYILDEMNELRRIKIE